MAKWFSLPVTAISLVLSTLLVACGGVTFTVVINSPPSNSQFTEGTEVMVEATASGQGIVRLELWVDGQLEDAALSPSPQPTFTAQLKWEASGVGSHTLEAFALTNTGQTSQPAAISIEVIAAVVEATPTPTSTPTPIATPTPTPIPIPTATPLAQISFGADDTDLLWGECTNLHWDVRNVKEVYLITEVTGGGPAIEPQTEGVAGENQVREVCPEWPGYSKVWDTIYTLQVKKLDGSIEERVITITSHVVVVEVTFTTIKILNDADPDIFGSPVTTGKGEIWFEFQVTFGQTAGSGRRPPDGTDSLDSGQSIPASYGGYFYQWSLDGRVTSEGLHGEVKGFEADASSTDSLGVVEFFFPGTASDAWEDTYCQTSTAADGQFQICYAVNFTIP